jgi:hypothetical protein
MKLKCKLFTYYVNDILTKEHICLALDYFQEENIAILRENTMFVILFKVAKEDGTILDISELQIVDNTQFDILKDIFYKFLIYLNNKDVHNIKIRKIIFAYSILNPPLAPVNYLYNTPIILDKLNEMSELIDILPNNRELHT